MSQVQQLQQTSSPIKNEKVQSQVQKEGSKCCSNEVLNGINGSSKIENRSQQKTEVKLKVDDSKLFEKKISIFGQKKENDNHVDIFTCKQSVNLFSMNKPNSNNTNVNIFKMASASKPSIINQEQSDLDSKSGDQIDHAKEQQLKDPIEKVMKYEYEQKTEKLASFKLNKFKNGQSSTKEGLVLTLEKDKEPANKIIYFIMRNQQTKINVFEGFLPNKLQLEHFMNREENWKLWVIHIKKDKEEKLVPEREMVKLQFENIEQAKQFERILKLEGKDTTTQA